MKKERWLQKWSFLFGLGGFLLTFSLTLISGNSWETALLRGVAGFFSLWLCGWILKGMLRDLLSAGQTQAGGMIDVSLPEEIPQMHKSQEGEKEDGDSFIPLMFGQGNMQAGTRQEDGRREEKSSAQEFTDEQARKLAEALRSLQK